MSASTYSKVCYIMAGLCFGAGLVLIVIGLVTA